MKCLYQNGYFKNTLKKKLKNMYNPKPLEQTARENIVLDDKQLNKKLAKR